MRPGQAHPRTSPPPSGVEALSDREKQALRLCLAGKSQADAAAAMGVSPNTVNAYWSSAREKLDVRKTFLAAVALQKAEA